MINRIMNQPNAAVFCLISLAFTGCVIQPSVPNYEATWPDEPELADSTSGAIYSVGHDVPLFESAVAHRVGDTVTIRLVESTNASKSSSTATKKDSTTSYGPPTGLGTEITVGGAPLAFGMENNTDFKGSGTSAQSNKLEGQITVTVAKRMANGNLLVRGQKWLTLNQGSEFVRVQGIIRPVDIAPDNSIPSFRVADAVISYGGQGSLADASSPGLLTRFFNSKWMPF
jgi:flagellar L-ring protein precursor FlgH